MAKLDMAYIANGSFKIKLIKISIMQLKGMGSNLITTPSLVSWS